MHWKSSTMLRKTKIQLMLSLSCLQIKSLSSCLSLLRSSIIFLQFSYTLRKRIFTIAWGIPSLLPHLNRKVQKDWPINHVHIPQSILVIIGTWRAYNNNPKQNVVFFFNNHSDTFELHYLMNFLWHVDQLLVLAFGAHFRPLLWVLSRTKSEINAAFSLVTLLIR